MAPTESKVRILLADEQSLFREAVRVVLESHGDMEVVAEARDGVQAVAEAERTEPQVAILSVALPNCDGIRATALIKKAVPSCVVILISGQEDLETLVDGLEAGASGFLTKSAPLVELIEAAWTVFRGDTLIPRTMLGALLARLISRRREEDEAMRKVMKLTRREREILTLLAEGADNDSIAQALVISPETARTHIQNVFGKLSVHSRLEAAAFVVQNGILAELKGA